MAGLTALSRDVRTREFHFSDADFEALRELVKRITGITLSDAKREMVYGRLCRRLRTLGLESFAQYRAFLTSPAGEQELGEFCNALTTNLTSFFRERHHFDYLRQHVLEPLAARARPPRLRLWSAACSSGEEPYSIAITVLETLAEPVRSDVRILATDIDSEVLERARAGVYAEDRLREMDRRRLQTFFRPDRSVPGQQRYVIRPEAAGLITFRQLNLMNALPMKGPLDVIFCRNVIIYFDKDTQRELFARIARLQRPGDLLFLGHSESLFNVSDDYALIGRTIYQRIEGPTPCHGVAGT